MPFRSGQHVRWAWSTGEGHGKVKERFDRKVQRKIKGTTVIRHGSKDNPAFLIEQDDGDIVLKLASELKED